MDINLAKMLAQTMGWCIACHSYVLPTEATKYSREPKCECGEYLYTEEPTDDTNTTESAV